MCFCDFLQLYRMLQHFLKPSTTAQAMDNGVCVVKGEWSLASLGEDNDRLEKDLLTSVTVLMSYSSLCVCLVFSSFCALLWGSIYGT